MPHPDPNAALDALPRVGFVTGPSPVTAMPELAAELGLGWLGAKRDDLLPGLVGGTKVRKLDHLLATPPWRDAATWTSVGAIGSGHLVALTAAARVLDRRVHAHLFWTPPTEEARESIAYVACGPTTLSFYKSRMSLALRAPRVVLGAAERGVVPAGGTTPAGLAGIVRAGLELAAQVAAGVLPSPDRVMVPLGTGGTAAGLALGLALGGLRPVVHAVAVVERAFSGRRRLHRLTAATRAWLAAAGVGLPEPAPLHIDRGHLGDGYARETPAARAACARLRAAGLPLEPVYSGKAMAALLGGAARAGDRVLVWITPRRDAPLPADPDWIERLPPALRRRLERAERRGPSRRRVILAGTAAALVAAGVYRTTGYPPLPGWQGHALSPWAAHVLSGAAEVVLPPGADARAAAEAADRYLAELPPRLQREARAMFAAIEHGTTPLTLRLRRFTRLEPAERDAFLRTLADRGGLQRQLYRGIRDLCLLGHYQQPATWADLGYGGPLVPRERRPTNYDALAAAPGQLPPGWQT